MVDDGTIKDGGDYEFEVVATAMLTVTATHGRAARDAVAAALAGVTARLTSGSGAGTELRGLRVVEHTIALRSIDGEDPTAALRALLDGWRTRGGRP